MELEDTVKEGSRTVDNTTETSKTSEETLKSRTKDLQLMGTAENRSWLASLKASIAKSFSKTNSSSITTETQLEYRININEIRILLEQLLDACKIETLYLCLDEFTVVDKNATISLQTNIAQLVKDTFFRSQHIVVKISSLWNREKMQVRSFGTDRRGVELGEDIKWSIDLDEIFFNSQINENSFFAELIGNIIFFDNYSNMYDDTKDSEKNIAYQRDLSISAGNSMIKKLFKTTNAYDQLVCGSQGIPRIFCNLINDCIMKTNKRNETVITFQDVRDAIIDNYTQGVRKKLPDGLELLGAIETFVLEQKTRFFLMSIRDFQKIQGQIEGVVDANAIHQYPSANVDRRLRNRYKLFMVHYGNFMEALAGLNREPD